MKLSVYLRFAPQYEYIDSSRTLLLKLFKPTSEKIAKKHSEKK